MKTIHRGLIGCGDVTEIKNRPGLYECRDSEKFETRAFIESLLNRVPFSGVYRFDEPMALHTTFKVGGPADVWIQSDAKTFAVFTAALLREAVSAEIPVFVLGGGANLVFSDKGIRGIVFDTGAFTGSEMKSDNTICVMAGTRIDAAAEYAAAAGRSGLEFLAGMPGTIGGAVYMNARCYDRSVSDVLESVDIIDEKYERVTVPFKADDYGYKRSPFQRRSVIILSVLFRTEKRDGAEIRRKMEEHRQDREAKGHYRYPCAGSAFKNNRGFGKPAGKIIDELGLRGLRSGGAMVAPYHGNIIINTGGAAAGDIKTLMDIIAEKARLVLGIELESEIIFAGDWK
ncbi:UDP-N-acetylenolpyruvoylglucosamine reductase [Spirochaetia bacterium]|nr:UDP-N-acetylenolpyruvoylglucosamine reductase [Spirochaetia bacterium]